MNEENTPIDPLNRILELMNEIHLILKTAGLAHTKEEQYIDNQEACQLLKVSKRTLQSYRLKKILPFTTLGGKIYFKMSDIHTMLKERYVNKNT